MSWLFYILVFLALLLHAPVDVLDPEARGFILIIGAVGVWRYGWGFVHFGRALWYQRVRFPAWRRRAEAMEEAVGEAAPRPELFIVVTAFRIPAETVAAMMRSAVGEAETYGGRVTIVASIVEVADERFIKALFRRLDPCERIRLVIVRLAGSGKRDGLAGALQAVSRQHPTAGALVVVMDGDVVLPPMSLGRAVVFFQLMPDLAGLTTDEDAVVAGSGLMRRWHRLRFVQRHVLMCSMALGRRLLTMTGRLSIYRVEVATDPAFIGRVRDDAVDHWRLGRIPLVTGEDKSTWLWLLERGHAMLYVPDIRVITIEHPPHPRFVRATSRLMMRWFGNMLRAGGEAIAMGPGRLGVFTWWCLIDQRVSMWTPLIGPLVAATIALTTMPAFLYVYALWVMLTRFIQALMTLAFRPTASGLYPLLIYYNQVWGALIKTYMLFRLDRQGWTRQGPGRALAARPRAALAELGSAYVHATALLALVAAIAFLGGLLPLPTAATFALLF